MFLFQGDVSDIYYKTLVGLKDVDVDKTCEDESENSESEPEESSDEDSNDESENKEKQVTPWMFVRKKEETAEERAERKKAVKTLQRENRLNKKPKHVKKRQAKVCKVNRQTKK